MSARNLLLAAACGAALASCSSNSDLKETLGLNRRAPDEFRVYARPPLTVPPEFSLRAPDSTTDAPTTTAADAQARSAVLNTIDSPTTEDAPAPKAKAGTNSSQTTGADTQFLQNAGAHKAKSDVRGLIKAEGAEEVTSKNSSYLLNPSASGEPIVDAAQEAERIKQNKADKKSPTDGETPVIEPKSKGILGTLGDLF